MFDLVSPVALAAFGILVGFIGLVWSADRFVASSATIAQSFGVAPLVIGLTIVSFGTSAPEVMVSISASLKNTGDLAVGNAIGSNIANIGLVLGITLLVASIPVQKHILVHEIPILLAITVATGVFLYDHTLDPWESWLLLLALAPVIVYLVRAKQKDLSPTEIAEEENIPSMARSVAFIWFALSLAALIVSAEVLVWGAKSTAEYFGVSPLVIGLTVIAVGTSLPELAASIMSAIKGHHDIAVGNVVGSNIFNLLAVMSIPGLVRPLVLESNVFTRDFSALLAMTLLLTAAVVIAIKRTADRSKLGKFTGTILLLCYISYMLLLNLL